MLSLACSIFIRTTRFQIFLRIYSSNQYANENASLLKVMFIALVVFFFPPPISSLHVIYIRFDGLIRCVELSTFIITTFQTIATTSFPPRARWEVVREFPNLHTSDESSDATA
mmetsp:Transcript_14956/g.36726  ORF Transcript_14956/g.36726 Transcript_14956/m.36726 type:complete len:113 (+) Transcript_14956:700-1038(+)